jgi:lysophospholipid acyltransferase (LPLAT)-like uncharacterized protein
MSARDTWLNQLGGLGTAVLTRHWMSTLDYRIAYYDSAVDPALPEFRGPAIFMFWHEYIPMLFYLRGHCSIAMLLSRHQDAELLSHAARHMGFQTVRGSTGRGGTAALRELIRKSNGMNLAITPDGPRGPRRRMSPGPIYLSSKLGIPLVAIGLGYDRPWRVSTWDKFAIPRPFTRARVIPSPFLQIPPDLDRDGVEHYRQHLEAVLNRLTMQAERWAESGAQMIEQRPLRRQPSPLRPRDASNVTCGAENDRPSRVRPSPDKLISLRVA